jgi:hypothetical protein
MPASLKVGQRDSRKSGTSSAPSVDLAVYGGQNGRKSTVSVARKATLHAPPRLFGQFQKRRSREFALGLG